MLIIEETTYKMSTQAQEAPPNSKSFSAKRGFKLSPLILTTPTKPLKQQGKTELLEFQERPKPVYVYAPCPVCPYQTRNGFCGVCNKYYNNPAPPES